VVKPIVDNGVVTGVIVEDTGSGYVATSNGTTIGAGGVIFGGPDSTLVYSPPPGQIIPEGTTLTNDFLTPDGTKISPGTIPSGTTLITDIILDDGTILVGGTTLGDDLTISFDNSIPEGSIISGGIPTPYDIEVPGVLDLPNELIDDFIDEDTPFSSSFETGDPDNLLKYGYQSYPPNTNILLKEGDQVFLPNGSTADVINQVGDVVDTLVGKGPTVPIDIKTPGNFTTPEVDPNIGTGDGPSDGLGKYPVLLCIKDILVLKPGINYSDGDEIIISPDNGAVAKPVFDSFGKVTDVSLINEGIGFTTLPEIFIKSRTGINSKLQPVFRVCRIGEDIDDSTTVPEGTQIITVVDCVGQVT